MRFPGTSYPWSVSRFPWSILPDRLWCWHCFYLASEDPVRPRVRSALMCAISKTGGPPEGEDVKEFEARMRSPGGWGEVGSGDRHDRYTVTHPEPDKSRRRMCRCGCSQKVTHQGRANGVTLMEGCEIHVCRWAVPPKGET